MDAVTLGRIYLRQANKTQNARAYLDDLITARLATLSSQQGGTIVSTTVNGKSVTYQALDGCAIDGQLRALELAQQALESGLPTIPTSTWGVTR